MTSPQAQGNDTLSGGNGNDKVRGGEGDDWIKTVMPATTRWQVGLARTSSLVVTGLTKSQPAMVMTRSMVRPAAIAFTARMETTPSTAERTMTSFSGNAGNDLEKGGPGADKMVGGPGNEQSSSVVMVTTGNTERVMPMSCMERMGMTTSRPLR